MILGDVKYFFLMGHFVSCPAEKKTSNIEFDALALGSWLLALGMIQSFCIISLGQIV